MNNLRFSRLGFCWLVLFCAIVAPRGQAQKLDENGQPIIKTVTTPPTWLQLSPPLEQTVDGVRVRLRAICWCRADQLDLPADQYVERDDALGLAVRYEVVGDAATDGKRGTLTQAKIYGASGAPNSALSPQSNIAPNGNGGVMFWTGANPRWKTAQLDLEWRGADQSENAQGKYSAPVEFEVPVPTQTDVAQAATGTWKSVHGTQYSMRQIMVATKPFKTATGDFEWQPGFYFSIQREYPPDAPGSDAFRDLDEDQPEVTAVDANGGQTEVKVEVSMGGWVPADILAPKKWNSIDSGMRSNNSKSLPPGTVSVRIRFIAREASDDWRDESALQKFHFPLDLSRVPLPPVDADWKPLATARGQQLEVALDNWRDVGGALTARLMTRDLAAPDDARILWLLRGSKISVWNDRDAVEAKLPERDDLKAAAGFEGVYTFTGPSQRWWRPGGAPILGSSQERDVTFGKPTAGAAPLEIAAPMAIEGTWEKWLAVEHDWTLDDLPIPAPGQTLVVNRELQGDGARLILRKLVAFDEKHPLPGEGGEFLAQHGRPSGIEATFEVLQTALSGARLDIDTFAPKQGTQRIETRDDQGRKLSMSSYGPSGGSIWTATFTLPARDAKSLSLHLTLTESALTGASETLTLRDLPQPTRPKQGDY